LRIKDIIEKIDQASSPQAEEISQITQGLLGCKIKSIIIPLLGDHVLRESNHYLRLLKMFGKAL
jgi:hypothetical protein